MSSAYPVLIGIMAEGAHLAREANARPELHHLPLVLGNQAVLSSIRQLLRALPLRRGINLVSSLLSKTPYT
jgi:hypothetical protein